MATIDKRGATTGRRQFLKYGGAAATVVGLAGCVGGDGGAGSDGGDGSDGGGDGSGGGDGGSTTTTSADGGGEDYDVEDKLVIYSPIPDDIIPWFEEKTGIDVELVTGVGPKVTARFFQEQSAGQYNADIMYGPTSTYLPNPDTVVEHTQTITDFGVDRQSVMPEGIYDKWSSKMPDELFSRLMPNHTLTNRVFTVSTSLDDPPTSYQDLLDSSYDENVVAQPFFMDTNAAVLQRALGSEQAARDYLQSLKEQNLLIQVKEVQPILEGRATVAFLATDGGGSITRMDQGAPITVTIPEEGVPQTAAAYVMAKNAPHPGAARKFMELQLSEEGQKYMQGVKGGRDPLRPEIPHGNERMRELMTDDNTFPMMLTREEIDANAKLVKDIWPDVAV